MLGPLKTSHDLLSFTMMRGPSAVAELLVCINFELIWLRSSKMMSIMNNVCVFICVSR